MIYHSTSALNGKVSTKESIKLGKQVRSTLGVWWIIVGVHFPFLSNNDATIANTFPFPIPSHFVVNNYSCGNREFWKQWMEIWIVSLSLENLILKRNRAKNGTRIQDIIGNDVITMAFLAILLKIMQLRSKDVMYSERIRKYVDTMLTFCRRPQRRIHWTGCPSQFGVILLIVGFFAVGRNNLCCVI